MPPPSKLTFVLASRSAGRLRVLRDAGIDPEVQVSGVDETGHDGLPAADLVQLLADRKAAAVAADRLDALVLGCDSLLELDGESLGKPADAAAATAMWRRLSGHEAALLTGHCLICPGDRTPLRGLARTLIRFGRPTDAEIAAYVATGEPMSLAGAFSIDGRSAPFIDGIDGDPSNVIGLSLPLLRRMLAGAGLSITDLWHPVPPPLR
ncbi:MAG: Maf family protein [Streptosporangiaceae bacterium]